MANTQELTAQVNALTILLNNITNSSKDISQLTLQDPAQLTSEIPVRYGSVDYKITVEQVFNLVNIALADSLDLKQNILQLITQVSATYTILNTEDTVECTANSFTVTLPTSVGIGGKLYNIKNTGSGVVTIDADSTETIDGELSQTISQWENITLQSNNTNWIIL